MSVQPKVRYTLPQYLALESSSPVKHELFGGEVFAMGGASYAHTVIVGNVVRDLGTQLKGQPCRVSSSDLRVKVSASGLYTYPDVVIVCGEPQLEQPGDTLTNPQLVIEVLSESTEAYDRGRKFAQYRMIESLTDYVLISQDKVLVEHYSRQADGRWLFAAASQLTDALAVASMGCKLALSEIYDKVDGLPAAGAA